MSRDQKPGKFKLVGNAKPNPGRRVEDQLAGAQDGGSGAVTGPAATGINESARRPGLLAPLLFLIGCAGGGAGVVWLGLVGGQIG